MQNVVWDEDSRSAGRQVSVITSPNSVSAEQLQALRQEYPAASVLLRSPWQSAEGEGAVDALRQAYDIPGVWRPLQRSLLAAAASNFRGPQAVSQLIDWERASPGAAGVMSALVRTGRREPALLSPHLEGFKPRASALLRASMPTAPGNDLKQLLLQARDQDLSLVLEACFAAGRRDLMPELEALLTYTSATNYPAGMLIRMQLRGGLFRWAMQRRLGGAE